MFLLNVNLKPPSFKDIVTGSLNCLAGRQDLLSLARQLSASASMSHRVRLAATRFPQGSPLVVRFMSFWCGGRFLLLKHFLLWKWLKHLYLQVYRIVFLFPGFHGINLSIESATAFARRKSVGTIWSYWVMRWLPWRLKNFWSSAAWEMLAVKKTRFSFDKKKRSILGPYRSWIWGSNDCLLERKTRLLDYELFGLRLRKKRTAEVSAMRSPASAVLLVPDASESMQQMLRQLMRARPQCKGTKLERRWTRDDERSKKGTLLYLVGGIQKWGFNIVEGFFEDRLISNVVILYPQGWVLNQKGSFEVAGSSVDGSQVIMVRLIVSEWWASLTSWLTWKASKFVHWKAVWISWKAKVISTDQIHKQLFIVKPCKNLVIADYLELKKLEASEASRLWAWWPPWHWHFGDLAEASAEDEGQGAGCEASDILGFMLFLNESLINIIWLQVSGIIGSSFGTLGYWT